MNWHTAYNSVYAVRFAHPNAFGTSQTREPLATSVKTDTADRYDSDKMKIERI